MKTLQSWSRRTIIFLIFFVTSLTESQILFTHSSVYPKKYCPKGVYSGFLNEREEPDGNGTYACRRYNYSGQWTRGRRNGQGLTEFKNGDLHAGNYYMDKFHGWGNFEWKNGRRYVGQFRDGKRDGRGEMTFPNGDKYIGDWVQGTRTGHGFYTFKKSGNRYKGDYVKGRKVGSGIFWWTSGRYAGSKYVGKFANDRRHGENGTYYYSNGDIYKGFWKNGRQDGPGVLKFKNGNKMRGNWVRGNLEGETIFIFPNGERYKSNFVKGSRTEDWIKIEPLPFNPQAFFANKATQE